MHHININHHGLHSWNSCYHCVGHFLPQDLGALPGSGDALKNYVFIYLQSWACLFVWGTSCLTIRLLRKDLCLSKLMLDNFTHPMG